MIPLRSVAGSARPLALLIALLARTVFGASNFDTYDRVLVPIAPVQTPVPGAYGSLWSVVCVAHNLSEQPVIASPYAPPPGAGVGLPPFIPPQATAALQVFSTDPNTGVFVFIDKGSANAIAFSLRIADLSPQLQTWGTAIPVVRDKDMFSSRLSIGNIPATNSFRLTLRVYDFDEPADRAVTVTVFDDTENLNLANVQLGQFTLVLQKNFQSSFPHEEIPGHAAADLTSFAALVGAGSRMRVEVAPLTPSLRFWAFVSTTDNATQLVTLALPD